jgi:hypothetical protein
LIRFQRLVSEKGMPCTLLKLHDRYSRFSRLYSVWDAANL